MANFMIRFLICNVLISGIIGILLIAKCGYSETTCPAGCSIICGCCLLGLAGSSLYAVPSQSDFPQIFSWLGSVQKLLLLLVPHPLWGEACEEFIRFSGTTDWMNDFALSVNHDTSSVTGYILLSIWIVGMLVMMILVIKSSLRLRTIKRSALPLQNPKVRRLYNRCLNEMKI